MGPLKILAFLSLGILIIPNVHSHNLEEELSSSLSPMRQTPESRIPSPEPLKLSVPVPKFAEKRRKALGFKQLQVLTNNPNSLLNPTAEKTDLIRPLNNSVDSSESTACVTMETRDMRTPSPQPIRLLPSIARPPFESKVFPGLEELEALIKGFDTLNDTTIIWDLDGVLTLDSAPDESAIPLIRANTRAINLYQEAVKKAALCIIASAWNNFDETLSKVEALDLAGSAKIVGHEPVHSAYLDPKIFPRVYYQRKGNVVSARYSLTGNIGPRDKHPYFFQKAFSLICLESDKRQHGEPISTLWRKSILFVEDSRQNIEQFDLDREYCLREYEIDILAKGTVTYFLLPTSTT